MIAAFKSTTRLCTNCGENPVPDRLRDERLFPTAVCKWCWYNHAGPFITKPLRACDECGRNTVEHRFRYAICKRCWYRKPPRGYYVYGWVAEEEVIYIGKGCRRRAWAKHLGRSGEFQASNDFDVQILMDGMDNGLALSAELSLIRSLNPRLNIAGCMGEPRAKAYRSPALQFLVPGHVCRDCGLDFFLNHKGEPRCGRCAGEPIERGETTSA